MHIGVCLCGFMHVSVVLERPQDNVRPPEGEITMLVVCFM